jgi:hypothetical protein
MRLTERGFAFAPLPSRLGATLSALLFAATVNAQVAAAETVESATRQADALFAGGFPIDDADPEQSVPSESARLASPVRFAMFLMELNEKAGRADKRHDYASAVKYYAALAKAVPGDAGPYSKLCVLHELAGDPGKALQACANAVARTGATLADYVQYVRLELARPEPPSSERLKDLDVLMQHLRAQAPASLVPARLRCDIALRLEDMQRLTECTAALHALAPNDPTTLSYEWARELRRRDYAAVRQLVERAKHSGMSPEVVQSMQHATEQALSPWGRALALWRSNTRNLVALVAALLLALIAVKLHRGRGAHGPAN